MQHPEGYEVKGLQWPGREASYDSNSRVPTGMHSGRTTYYVFGCYPANTDDPEYPVIDLVLCHGDFLNADHTYVHENKSFRGFGSYGDLLVRDRKMYVAPTPFALTSGTTGQATLIATGELALDGRLEQVGELVRIETDGKQHRFAAYRLKGMGSGTVSMKNLEQVEEQPLSDEE